MFRWRPSLAFTLAAFMALAFLCGAIFVAASSPWSDHNEARLRDIAAHAADHLRAGMVQRRREIEFLAAAMPDPVETKPEALRLFLRRAQELSPYYVLIGYVDADGRMVVSSNGLAEGADVSTRDYFKRGRIGSFVSDAHPAILLAKALGAADSAPRLIDVAAPVTAGRPRPGVLVAHISAEWAQVIATTTSHEGHARVDILAADGELIASAEESGGELGKRGVSQSDIVPGFGDGGAAHWIVTASAPLSLAPGLAGYTRSSFVLLTLVGAGAAGTIGWALGRKITGSIEAQTRNVVFLPAGRIPDLRDEPAPELSDLGAAVRMAAEELAERRS